MQEEKPVTPERRPTTGQWAQMAMKSIGDHLAPKGFSFIRAGVFKGKEKANIEFLERSQVEGAGKIAASMVNHHRKRVKEYYTRLKDGKLQDAKAIEEKRNTLSYWKFKERARAFKRIEDLHTEASLLEEITKELDFITIQ